MPRPRGEPTTTYNLRLPERLLERARRAAASEGFDLADLFRRALRSECDRVLGAERHPKPKR